MSPSEAARRLAELCTNLGLGDDPQAIIDPLEALYADIDRNVATRAEGLELPCRVGCDACCHESVFLSAPEWLYVVRTLLTWPDDDRAAVVHQMNALALQFEDELLLLETIEPGAERDEVAMRVRFRCPLLGPNGGCTIYAARELNGRTFGQSWDDTRDEPYGCELTHARLAVLPSASARQLASARAARRRLVETVPGTERVHVYPWWFTRYGQVLEG